jgi:hypothetical protein
VRWRLFEHCSLDACEWERGTVNERLLTIAIKFAQLFKTSTGDFQGATLAWEEASYPPPKGSPQLHTFIITRSDEPEHVVAQSTSGNRRLNSTQLEDSWLSSRTSVPGETTERRLQGQEQLLYMAFRMDTTRVPYDSEALTQIIMANSSFMQEALGGDLVINNADRQIDAGAGTFDDSDYKVLYQFLNYNVNQNPFRCYDPCYVFDEQSSIHGPGRCAPSNHCQCNGARKCDELSHCIGDVGICGGVLAPTKLSMNDAPSTSPTISDEAGGAFFATSTAAPSAGQSMTSLEPTSAPSISMVPTSAPTVPTKVPTAAPTVASLWFHFEDLELENIDPVGFEEELFNQFRAMGIREIFLSMLTVILHKGSVIAEVTSSDPMYGTYTVEKLRDAVVDSGKPVVVMGSAANFAGTLNGINGTADSSITAPRASEDPLDGLFESGLLFGLTAAVGFCCVCGLCVLIFLACKPRCEGSLRKSRKVKPVDIDEPEAEPKK